MGDEHVEFLEAALVEQQLEALARGQLALGVLDVDAALAAAEAGLGPAGLKLVEDVLHGDALPCDVTHSGGFRAPWLQKL